MSDSFWNPGDQFLVWASNVVLQVGLVAALAGLIGLVLRRSSAARYWLLCSALLVVMICPVLTAVVQTSGLSMITVKMIGTTPRIEEVRPNEVSIEPRIEESRQKKTFDTFVVPAMVPTEINVAPLERHDSHASDAVSEAFHASPAATPTVLQSITMLGRVLRIVGPPLVAIWAIVAAALLMRLFIQWYRLSLLLRSAEPNTDEGFANTFQAACAALGISPGRVPTMVFVKRSVGADCGRDSFAEGGPADRLCAADQFRTTPGHSDSRGRPYRSWRPAGRAAAEFCRGCLLDPSTRPAG